MKRNKKGFSLIEVVVAVSIAAVAFLAIYNLNSANINTTSTARDQAQATRLVQEGMEAVRSIRSSSEKLITFGGVAREWNGFVAAVPADSAPVTLMLSYTANKWSMTEASSGFTVSDAPTFQRRVSVSKISSDSGLLTVKIEACWGKTDVNACFSPTTRLEQYSTAQTKLGPKNNFVN